MSCTYCSQPSHVVARCATRKQDIVELYVSGETMQAIGDVYGLTRARVQQIVARADGPDLGAVDKARAARRTARLVELDVLRDRLLQELQRSPGGTRAELAQRLGVRPAEVSAVLGKDARRLLVTEGHVAPTWTREQMLHGLRRAAAWVGHSPMSGQQYDEAAHRLTGLVSGVRLEQVFGSWNAALTAAGLPTRPQKRAYRRRWTNEQVLEHVVAYLTDSESSGTVAGYTAWAATNEAPSGPLVRIRLGTWQQVKTAALVRMAERQFAA